MRADPSPSPLFPAPVDERVRPLGRVEPAVHWLTESTRPEATASRQTVNRWYASFPDVDGKFAARVRSENDVDHHQALDELHVHHLLARHNPDVRYEEGGVGPDFRIYNGGTCVGAVEVLSLFEREDWDQEQRRHDRLADELDRRVPPTAGYFVNFKIEVAEREPAPRRFAEFVERRIAELPPYDQFEIGTGPGRPQLPSAVYERDGCRISIEFWPMKPGAATLDNPDGRITGLGHLTSGFVNSSLRLRDRLTDKAGGRYEIDGFPFLVVAGVHDSFCTDDQVIDALYGQEAVVIATSQLTRYNDGFFGLDRERSVGRNTRVSAVGVVSGRRLWQDGAADVAILENPYQAVQWPHERFAPTRVFGPVRDAATPGAFGWRDYPAAS